jgi:hypothetical protein
MNPFWTIAIGAVVVGVIALVIGVGYVSASSSKLPEQIEMIQLFVSGSIVGGFASWILASGYLHGTTLMGMLASDVKNTLKEVGLKGGDEIVAAAPSTGVSEMVGGFLKSMGVAEALQEMKVGMPGF